jgi:hypothetical protein
MVYRIRIPSVERIHLYSQQLEEVETTIPEQAEKEWGFEQLQQLPGIGPKPIWKRGLCC